MDDLEQLGTIGLDDKVDGEAVSGASLDGSDDGDKDASGAENRSGPLPDVAADDIEDEIDLADVLETVVFKIDKFMYLSVLAGEPFKELLIAEGLGDGAVADAGEFEVVYVRVAGGL